MLTKKSRRVLLLLGAEFAVVALASSLTVATYAVLHHVRPEAGGTYLPLIGGSALAAIFGAVTAKHHHIQSRVIRTVTAIIVGVMTILVATGFLISLFGS